jgi:GNAT superfamily N-acetyltransferase
MPTIEALNHFADAGVTPGAALPDTASPDDPHWMLRRARPSDAADVKALFWKLHAFNAGLDPRFALAEDWETSFAPLLERAMGRHDALCLLARARHTGQPCRLALATIHRDVGLWRFHEWVEVEALYVEDRWRGRGVAAALLARACIWANSVGQPVGQLYVTASNEQALQFYRREGFELTQAILRKVLA